MKSLTGLLALVMALGVALPAVAVDSPAVDNVHLISQRTIAQVNSRTAEFERIASDLITAYQRGDADAMLALWSDDPAADQTKQRIIKTPSNFKFGVEFLRAFGRLIVIRQVRAESSCWHRFDMIFEKDPGLFLDVCIDSGMKIVELLFTPKNPNTAPSATIAPTRPAQSASLGPYRNVVSNCYPGARSDGSGTEYDVQLPNSWLQNMASSSYIISLLNQTMIDVIQYCNSQAGKPRIDQSSRFFAHINTPSYSGVTASKELGQNTWKILQNDTALALQKQQQDLNAITQQAAQAQAAARAQAAQAQNRLAILRKFANQYGASAWVPWDRLFANVFALQDKAYLFNTTFKSMISPTSGIFEPVYGGTQYVVSNIPGSAFTDPDRTVLLAGRVLGTTHVKNGLGAEVSAVQVKYLGHYVCPIVTGVSFNKNYVGNCNGVF
jgi:hypothetical protein